MLGCCGSEADRTIGVPSREQMDPLLKSLPEYFEAKTIHVAGLIVASYAGEEYSHFLAKSSLGTWLKEQNIPAIYGVDTRALTKKIRQQGSMLGRLLLQKPISNIRRLIDDITPIAKSEKFEAWRDEFEIVDWVDPNKKNLVAEGMLQLSWRRLHISNNQRSFYTGTPTIFASRGCCSKKARRQADPYFGH